VGRTVLIVDDHPEFRLCARDLLEAAGFEVVGEAGDVEGALQVGRELRPDLVLVDVRLPGGSGVDVARAMRAWSSAPVVVLISTADYSHAVRGCGASGFILKINLSAESLRAVIDTV
jgi:DNA-binding NarL/FixJ family response regulator